LKEEIGGVGDRIITNLGKTQYNIQEKKTST
jgi:hypothetical protein